MNEESETLADIVAEMRAPHDEICEKCHEEPNESCPYCGDPDGCNSPDYGRWPGVMTQFADRIEAAAKRMEVIHNRETEHYKQERNEAPAKERKRLRDNGFMIIRKEDSVGNAAKLREAIGNALAALEHVLTEGLSAKEHRAHFGDIVGTANARTFLRDALKAPARNCDRFTNLHDAWLAWQAYCAEHMEDPTMKKFQVWLYDTAKEAV